MNSMDLKRDTVGTFDTCDEKTKELIQKLSGSVHYRNALQHPDGSSGEIRITSKELRDMLAYMAKYH